MNAGRFFGRDLKVFVAEEETAIYVVSDERSQFDVNLLELGAMIVRTLLRLRLLVQMNYDSYYDCIYRTPSSSRATRVPHRRFLVAFGSRFSLFERALAL